MKNDKKIYLPGLLGLRFIAAFTVFFGHLEQAKEWVHLPSFGFPFSISMPDDGVTFFFVLSGFLITYLLLNEQEKYGTISISQFYKRRVLRIWPLYYLFTALVFFVMPQIAFLQFPRLDMQISGDFWTRLGLFVVMSPQIAILMFVHPGVGGPLWSVGVEEYFYFAWPHIIKHSKKFVPWALLTVAILPILLRMDGPVFYLSEFMRVFFRVCRFDCMAIGGLGAWLYLNKRKYIEFIFSYPVQAIAYFFAFRHLMYYIHYGDFDYSVYSLIYIVIIMNISLNAKSPVKLENKFFNFMGTISYGLYVFQWMCNVITVNFIQSLDPIENDTLRSIVLLVLDLALTTAFAAASYYLWERRFLVMKKKYSPIIAGTSAIENQ